MRYAALPAAPGVYRFRDATGRVLYFGRAVQLRRRVESYWGDLRDRAHLASMVARVARVEATVCDSEHEAAWLERNLLERSLPRWNRTSGVEVPVYLRLSRAGLAVAHEPAAGGRDRYFGPYLGGARVRLTCSALHRVFPLAYTGDRLTGSERELGRRRGVEPAARSHLYAAVSAVLEREADALATLRAGLHRRRDEAAAAQAYELAARVQAELAAVDWVLAEQKVTLATPTDLDVYGWAGGILVQYGIRAGRLCTWRQRPATRGTAEPRLAATPGAWRPFAQRAATLAAALTVHSGVDPRT